MGRFLTEKEPLGTSRRQPFAGLRAFALLLGPLCKQPLKLLRRVYTLLYQEGVHRVGGRFETSSLESDSKASSNDILSLSWSSATFADSG